jgi:hypothetical protein
MVHAKYDECRLYGNEETDILSQKPDIIIAFASVRKEKHMSHLQQHFLQMRPIRKNFENTHAKPQSCDTYL